MIGILWFSYDLPDVNHLQASVRKPGVTVQAQDGTIIGTYGDLYEDMVKISELPPYVPQAFMAIEDRRFYSHFGVDLIGLVRAAYTNYKANRVVQGGSTLTQQLAKNFLFTQGMYDIQDRSLRRKVQEAIMALWLEWKFTKEQIFTIYLNRVYFGAGTYGIEAASRKYFNKSARQLTVYEAAVIAGLLKAPSRYSPTNSPKKARERATIVLHQMADAGYIKSVGEYLHQQDQMQQDQINLQGSRFFADWVYENIPGLIGAYDQDLIVLTTFDPRIQKHAEDATKETMEKLAKEYKTTEISLVAMTPQGAVKAMIGGMNYNKSQYNRVTQALRQPGSAFKPFVYLAGLEAGMSPDTIFSDDPVSIGKWAPKNFRKYQSIGEITMRQALTKSVNTVTVRIALEVGAKKIGGVAQRLGITSDMIPDMSISLGTTEVTLLELVSAYATFANQGKSVWAYGISEIRNRDGDILYQRENVTEDQVIDPKHVRQMNDMLMNVINHGTGRAARLKCGSPGKTEGALPIQVAGKTGSNADKDAWFIGFTQELVAGIWTGNDNNAPMIKNSTGGRIPAQTFSAFMSPITCDNPPAGSLLPAGDSTDSFAPYDEQGEPLAESIVAGKGKSVPDVAYAPPGSSVFDEPASDDRAAFDNLLDQAAQD
ncbi:transglycosylase domain-containing protein [Candidatus Paracaedibacter symbiosus]|uniref:transglycosylase domain-containing protein n=1 Tax=Candidatus Paracaedibacter symbiosus TaxID=244582 RepID=UPI0012EB89EC|nr:PBP1A family penicillin-binding protein [Candidatus Paracaedibacter symbiosus]